MSERNRNIDQEELAEMSQTIQFELDNLAEFKYRLGNYSKQSLILFVLLAAEPSQFRTILEILTSLEELPENH